MPLPVGIDTCTVTLSVPLDALGNLATSLVGTVKPDRYLVWEETGEPILEVGAKLPTPSGGVVTMTLPTTNQDGILDSEGNAVTDWSYRIHYQVAFANRQKASFSKPFQIDEALTVLDLDSVPFGNVVSPAVTAPGGTVSSAAGLTGVVSASALVAAMEDALAADYVPAPTADLAGGTLRTYGDSWSAGYGLPADSSFSHGAADDHSMSTVENLGVTGSAAQTIGHLMLATGAYRWDEGDADAVVICAGLNDSRYKELTSAANVAWLRAMRHSLRLAAALVTGKQRIPYSDAAWSWSSFIVAGYVWSSNGATVRSSNTPGATGTYSFTDTEVTVVVGGSNGESKAVAEFYIDDVLVRTVRFHDDVVLYPGSTATVGWRAEKFTGLPPGPHTLKIKKADSSAHYVNIDSAIHPLEDPPTLVFVKESPPITSSYTDPTFAPYNVGSPASTYAAHKVIEEVAAAFDGARVAPYVVLDTATDFQADTVHPDASGSAKLQATVTAALDPQVLRDRLDNLAARAGVARALDVPQRVAVAQFTSSAVLAEYKVPEGAVSLRIRALGGGGGGGSGRRGAAGSVRCGGGGGAGAGACEITVPTFGLPPTLYVTCGAGGTGGAAVTADDTNGNAGGVGVSSYVVTDSAALSDEGVYLAHAPGGAGGAGGTNAAGAGGVGGASRSGLTASGGAASATGGAGAATVTNGYNGVGQGGGAGGGITSANVAGAGGAGWWSGSFLTSLARPSGGANTGVAGGTGALATATQGRLDSGMSAGGGGANLTGAGGAGGVGGAGSGGGGGGASVNGNNSGAGGAGGVGFVEITALF